MDDDPDYRALSPDEKERIIRVLEKMMEMGIGAVYGDEDDGVPDAAVDCEKRMNTCRSICCTFQFALTKEEVEQGAIGHNLAKPFFIAREEDGYCPHLDRDSLQCSVWHERPLRCRQYDCRNDREIWPLLNTTD